MRRGELYRVPIKGDAKRSRIVVIVSREPLIVSAYSTVICVPVYTSRRGLESEVLVGVDEGLKHPSAVVCDELVSVSKVLLSKYVGSLGPKKLEELGRALRVALDLEEF